MSEDKKIVSLAERRAERLAASQDEAFARGEVFRFEHIHLKEFHPGTTEEGDVVLNRIGTNEGFLWSEEEARELGIMLIELAGEVRTERFRRENPEVEGE